MSSYPTVDKKKLNELETKLGYHFRNVELLERALTHTSYANEQGLNAAHNERQEFLGDAVMELCVSAELFRRFPDTREGDLTRLRSSLVSTHSFANFARQTGIDRLLFLGRGEEAQGGRTRDTNLSDVFEAVMAAIYQDGGFEACQKTVARIFEGHWPKSPNDAQKERDHKTALQECVQHRFGGERPYYTLQGSVGPSHARVFTSSVFLPGGREFTAEGTSVKKSEQNAAALALEWRASVENRGGRPGGGK